MTGQRRVHVTGEVPRRVAEALEQDFELVSDPADAEGILALITTTVDDAYLERAGPQLEVVANYGVGVNNIDLEAARRRGIVIANTPDVLTRTTAELAIAVTLALLRRVVEGDRFIRSRAAWSFSLEFMLGEGLDGKTFGIVGPGRIGRETARLAEAFGAQHCLRRPRRSAGGAAGRRRRRQPPLSTHAGHPPPDRRAGAGGHEADGRAGQHRPGTDRGRARSRRRPLSGVIAGAALDVFEFEPEVSDELLALDQVVLTPHMGSGTRSTREAMGMLAVDALRSVLIRNGARRTPSSDGMMWR